MRTVLIHLEGELNPGDIITIEHTHPRSGGRSSARYDVPSPTDTIQVVNGQKTVVTVGVATTKDAIARLVQEANKWDGFSARQRNDHEMIVQCSDSVDQSIFSGEGSGGQIFTIEVLA